MQLSDILRQLSQPNQISDAWTNRPQPPPPEPGPLQQSNRPKPEPVALQPPAFDFTEVLRDFNAIATDDGQIDAFAQRWKPHMKEVVMTNFNQRVAESAHRPDLRIRDAKTSGDVHFWFFGPNSDGYLLPGKSLLRYRAALGLDSTVKAIRPIFVVVSAPRFRVERAARAKSDGSVVVVSQPGALCLPQTA